MTNGEIILKLIKDITGIELELEEEFYMHNNLLKVTQEGLVYADDGSPCNVSLVGFIKVIKKIKIKHKFPKDGTKYYWVSPDSSIHGLEFWKSTIDVLNFKIGNFFSTREEAEQNKEKIMKILNSPERFELK